MNGNLTFRYADKNDVPLILKFIIELAKYEKPENEVVATEELLEKWLFESKKERLSLPLQTEPKSLCPVFSQFFNVSRTCRHITGNMHLNACIFPKKKTHKTGVNIFCFVWFLYFIKNFYICPLPFKNLYVGIFPNIFHKKYITMQERKNMILFY